MSPAIIIAILFISLLAVLVTGLPVGFSLGGLSIVFIITMWGSECLGVLSHRAFEVMSASSLLAMPMFIFMALVLRYSGIGQELYKMMYCWLGGVRGGLAMGTVVICTVIAAMSGIAGAGVVMMAIVALPEMLKRGYNKSIAIGCILAGGVLGLLIPPSVGFIIYGMMARESIGRLFAGGVFPGLMLSGFYMTYIGVRSHLQPSLCPAVPKEERFTWKEKFTSLRGVLLPLILVTSVLGSIFAGIASPSEAAAVGAVGAVACALIQRRFSWRMFKEVSIEAILINGMCMWIILGAFTFSAVFIGLGGTSIAGDLVSRLALSPSMTILLMQISYLFLGCFLDDISILAISLPAYLPIVRDLGFSTLWFGVLYEVNMQVAYLTPPFGYCLFYMKGACPKDITMKDIYRSVLPFVMLQILGLVLLWRFPQLALWLPSILFS